MKQNNQHKLAGLKRSSRGFTLVELLVVIAILGVLATVSIIGYTTYIGKANDAKDSFVVDEMNEHLRAGYKVEHAGEAIDYPTQVESTLEGKGYKISTLVPARSGVYYAYDNKTQSFLSVEKNGTIHYDGGETHAQGPNIFVFVQDEDTRKSFQNCGYHYSSYLQ